MYWMHRSYMELPANSSYCHKNKNKRDFANYMGENVKNLKIPKDKLDEKKVRNVIIGSIKY